VAVFQSGVQLLGAGPSGLPRSGLLNIYLGKSLIFELLPAGFAMFLIITTRSAATSRA
jgi:hypothetical protein